MLDRIARLTIRAIILEKHFDLEIGRVPVVLLDRIRVNRLFSELVNIVLDERRIQRKSARQLVLSSALVVEQEVDVAIQYGILVDFDDDLGGAELAVAR